MARARQSRRLGGSGGARARTRQPVCVGRDTGRRSTLWGERRTADRVREALSNEESRPSRSVDLSANPPGGIHRPVRAAGRGSAEADGVESMFAHMLCRCAHRSGTHGRRVHLVMVRAGFGVRAPVSRHGSGRVRGWQYERWSVQLVVRGRTCAPQSSLRRGRRRCQRSASKRRCPCGTPSSTRRRARCSAPAVLRRRRHRRVAVRVDRACYALCNPRVPINVPDAHQARAADGGEGASVLFG